MVCKAKAKAKVKVKAKAKAIFFDKDGVLHPDIGVSENSCCEEIRPFDYVAKSISWCRQQGYKIFIITNQAVVARGWIDEESLQKKFNKFREELLTFDANAFIDEIYYCPHHPNANLERYRVNCQCRKPSPGLLLQAAREHNLSLAESFLIGDRPTDIMAGHLAGCKTILCLSGKHDDPLIEYDNTINNVAATQAKENYTIENISLKNISLIL